MLTPKGTFTHNEIQHDIYRPKRSFGQGNIFTPVCHSVHGGEGFSQPGGVSLPDPHPTPPWDGETPPEQTPPRMENPPPQSRWRTPAPGAEPILPIIQPVTIDTMLNWTTGHFYRPQQSWGKVMFLHMSVILFMGGSAPLHAGIHPQDQRQAPRWSRHPTQDQAPPRADTPEQTSPQDQAPPSTVHAGRYGQQAGGTHPTGMQSCLKKKYLAEFHYVWTRLKVCTTVEPVILSHCILRLPILLDHIFYHWLTLWVTYFCTVIWRWLRSLRWWAPCPRSLSRRRSPGRRRYTARRRRRPPVAPPRCTSRPDTRCTSRRPRTDQPGNHLQHKRKHSALTHLCLRNHKSIATDADGSDRQFMIIDNIRRAGI